MTMISDGFSVGAKIGIPTKGAFNLFRHSCREATPVYNSRMLENRRNVVARPDCCIHANCKSNEDIYCMGMTILTHRPLHVNLTPVICPVTRLY